MTKFDEEGFKKKYLKGIQPILQHMRSNSLGPLSSKYPFQPVPTLAGVFGCCGARQMTGMDGAYLMSEEIRQEFVCQLLRLQGKATIFYLPTTSQLKKLGENKYSIIKLLAELGGKEVHKNPNRIHGPNSLHLHVLDPGTKEYKKAIDRFLVVVTTKDYYGYATFVKVPRYMVEEFGYPPYKEGPEEVEVGVAPAVAKKTSPLRDAFGRFVKRI